MRESHWLDELKKAVDMAIQLEPTCKAMSEKDRRDFKEAYPHADAAIGGFGIILPEKHKPNPQD